MSSLNNDLLKCLDKRNNPAGIHICFNDFIWFVYLSKMLLQMLV